MKDYKEVVKDRFDQEQTDVPSIYAPDQPIGIYSRKALFGALDKALDALFTEDQRKELRLLDAGCGNGEMLDFFAGRGFSANNLYGTDLSSTRIERAKVKYPTFSFAQADILSPLPFEEPFDMISSFDLFSHLKTEEQIVQGLKHVNASLKSEGLFLWFDIASKDHYAAPEGCDSWGFSAQQLESLAQKAGFSPVLHHSIYRLFFNKYHSLYQARRIPHGLLSFLERILPGMPGNYLYVFKKIG